MNFVPSSKRKEMLASIGAASVDELFAGVEPKLKEPLKLPQPMSEMELAEHMRALAAQNRPLRCFVGAGAYDHYIPSAVKHIVGRSEFLTSYTPYQAEASQGMLQAIYEFQTYICLLTGMDVANSSMYDGASALAEAAFLSAGATERREVLVANNIHPQYLDVLRTYCAVHGLKVRIGGSADEKTACVIVQSPDFCGNIENVKKFSEEAHSRGALLVSCVVEPTSLAFFKPPGELGADVVVGEGQSFGNPLSFGGPYLGFMAVEEELVKRIPGRLVGMAHDKDGNEGFVLTLQAREQHIRRERASSNICSNHALCALAATVYLALMGRTGLRNAAARSYKMAHLLQQTLAGRGFELVNKKPFYNEFAVRCPISPSKLNSSLLRKGIVGGLELENNQMLLCCTEKTDEKDIDEFVAIAGERK